MVKQQTSKCPVETREGTAYKGQLSGKDRSENSKKAETGKINLKISSSYIGMESDRTYQSRSTGKLLFRVQKGSTNKDSSIRGGFHNDDVLRQEHALAGKEKDNLKKQQRNAEGKQQENTETREVQELIEAQGNLGQRIGIRRIPQLNRMEEYNALEDIRQKCILYLWNIFFGESRANEMAEKMGIAGNTNRTFTLTAERETLYMESENTSFTTTGTVKTADGREISFHLDVTMSRNFVQYTKETVKNVSSFIDPLVINLEGNIAQVSDQKFYFDLNADGEEELISCLCEDSGYLALDKNQDGLINDGSELFGTQSGNGFKDLAVFDNDGNGWIDENDDIWMKLKIWVQDEQGNSKLYSLAEKGVGAICLQNVSTEFSQRDLSGNISAAIRNTGIFLYENGGAGTIQHLDLAKTNIANYA